MSTPLTWLYVPGNRPDRFDKAAASGADVVVLDLEDAVAAADKDAARRAVVDHLAIARTGPARHVRINSGERGLGDLAAIADLPGLSGIRVPKIESIEEIETLAIHLPESIPIWALIESAAGVARIESIAAHERIAGIALGEQDLAKELSITSPAAFDHIRLRAVLAAATAGIAPVAMSVYPNVRDEHGLAESTRHGRALGMFGRSVIHPRQIAPVRSAFTPAPDEVRRAREVVEAADSGGATALPDGRFIDAPILYQARRILDLADRLTP